LHLLTQVIADTYTNNLQSIHIIYNCTEQTLDTEDHAPTQHVVSWLCKHLPCVPG